MSRLPDAELVDSIREATAAWNAPQDAIYYAEKHGIELTKMLVMLHRLEAAGLVEQRKRRAWGEFLTEWIVKEPQP
jgi:hypothetical protein